VILRAGPAVWASSIVWKLFSSAITTSIGYERRVIVTFLQQPSLGSSLLLAVGERTTSATTTCAESQGWYSTPCWIIAGGFIGRSIGEVRGTEQPKVPVIFSKWNAISWKGSLVARGSELSVWTKVTCLSLFDGPQ